MLTIKVNLKKVVDNSYEIKIGAGVLKSLKKDLGKIKEVKQWILVTDSHLKNKGQLLAKKIGARIIVIPAGEKSKSSQMKAGIEKQMLALGCSRDTGLIAFGGGMVGDLTGYVAATYMRGLPYVQIPTSLLALVDSSVGGKTGIDAPQGKNLIGAFWQPKLVVGDLNLLKTLPKKEFLNGFLEMVKIFIVKDEKAFTRLEKKGVKDLTSLVKRAVELKVQIVAKDEREGNLRSILNFGHTIGHALEQLSDYKLKHGEAVGIGMIWEARLAHKLGYLGAKDLHRIVELLRNFGVNEELKYSPELIVKMTKKDKKVKGGKVNYVLLEKVGQVKKLKGSYTQVVADRVVLDLLKNN